MQKMIRGLTCLAATSLLATAIQPVFAADKAENQLVGIKLWRGFKDVLAKHGQPTRIEIGAVATPMGGGQGAGGSDNMGAPMMGGSGGMMGSPMMGGKMGAMMGMGRMGGGMSGGSGLPGLSGMGPMGGGMSGGRPGGGSPYGGMMAGRGKSGRGAMDDGEGGPSAGGPMNPGAGLGGFGLAGGGMGGSDGGISALGNEGEVTWVYDRPGGLTYMFLFNKDGRVIQIQEYGYKGGSPTGAGITLGDSVHKVYGIYGWANASSKNGNQLTLDFSQKHHVAFQLLDQGHGPKVIGITLAITERGQIPGQ